MAVVAKSFTIIFASKIFFAPDPVFTFIPNGIVTIIAIGFELWIGYKLIKNNECIEKYILIIYMCVVFIAYKAGLLITGYDSPCGCFGSEENGALLFLKTYKLNQLSNLFIAIMLIPSAVALIIHRYKASCGKMRVHNGIKNK
ncbi:hypothetical protein NXS98_08380 [Fontisphaera persica]|uniref:MauE/DoxX family redox-associated membrane protein n=1 Tax=Fontisphaera persica TaxID=2974023 RepID=UPI0024C007ED|nr:MauE/DoxX family redox-associated membrane protein [Fontisphaera persica]WCJ61124.1 hypothetical protein NXS98_08380 [Fontisphaera persica]